MMQMVVVAFVAICIFLYMRSKHLARRRWLQRLDLPGLWHWQDGKATLTLTGGYERGRFTAVELAEERDEREGSVGEPREIEGEWSLSGHHLTLTAPGYAQTLELTLYQPGSIGLEDETGVRRAYQKEASNVVPLNRR